MARMKYETCWPLKNDCEMLKLAKTRTLETIADKLQRPESTVLKRAGQTGPVDQTQEAEMKRRPRSDRSKDTWYVSFEPKDRPAGRYRMTETFRNERDAKEFAKTRLTDGSNVSAGTLNPLMPKRTVSSKQVLDWFDEPDH